MNSAVVPPAQFQNRKAGLVFFGVLTLLGGCLFALFVPLIIFAVKMAEHTANPPPRDINVSVIAVMYGSLAIAHIWLGIGSIKARRWARALLAICSWSALAGGLMTIVAMAFMWPRLAAAFHTAQRSSQPQVSEATQSILMLIPMAMFGLMFVLLPLVWALFYSSKNVKATCEAYDRVPRWTDRCPLPVLAISLWLAFGALWMLMMPIFHSVAPLFGILLSGPTGVVFYLLLAAVWIYCAWALYHLDKRAWWIIVFAMILVSISSSITYSRYDLAEVYSRMGYSAARIAEMQKFGIGQQMVSWTVWIFTIPFLGYLFYIRKFLTDRRNPTPIAQ